MLPDDVPLLGESKKLIRKKQDLFVHTGEAALPEIKKINVRLRELLKKSKTDFPLSDGQTAELRANLREIVLKIGAVEKEAVNLLQRAIL